MPPNIFKRVVFPAPEAPTITNNLLRSKSKLISSLATILELPDLYSFVKLLISIYAITNLSKLLFYKDYTY